MTKYSVFLSYSSNDREAVRQVAEVLRRHGVTVWFDEWEVSVGDRISARISDGLNESSYIAVWLTKASVSSGWVETEWQSAFQQEIEDKRVKVLPLLAEDCTVPTLLKDKRYADFRGSFDEGMESLLGAIRPGYHYDFLKYVEEQLDLMKGYPLEYLQGMTESELERMFRFDLPVGLFGRASSAFSYSFRRFLEWLRAQDRAAGDA